MIRQIEEFQESWDVIIIGGGATGLGCAVDSASRGYKTLLLEQHDFAKGTSSRSTKLIHGGLRYLQKGNLALILEALKERGLLCQNAPHLICHRAFCVPTYHWWEGPFYGIGLKIYDLLAGKLGIESSMRLSKKEVLKRIPTLESKGLKGGVIYYDGQFDDARLALTLARTFVDLGGTIVNYMPVTALNKQEDLIYGVNAIDLETEKEYNISASVVINATGIFSDKMRKIDNPECHSIICPSQGVHLVLDKAFLQSDTAILIPHIADGRVLFIVPWHDRLLVGTTDTPMKEVSLEPTPLDEEIDFILEHAGQYLSKQPGKKDILSVFAGLRPLVNPEGSENTSAIARDHRIIVSDSGLVTIAGGKWTTFRKMGEDTIKKAALVGSLPERETKTAHLHLHGWLNNVDPEDPWSAYGSDVKLLRQVIDENPEWQEPLDPNHSYLKGEVIWAARHEMARSVEDVLSRRTRFLLLDAEKSVQCAPMVAKLMTHELGYDHEWVIKQIKNYEQVAKKYVI